MVPVTKADLVMAALRKAALASETTLTDIEPQQMEDGLQDLELMIAEWSGPSGIINTGYITAIYNVDGNREIIPESPHGVYDYALNGVILCLAVRLLPDYKSEAGATLQMKASYAKQVIINYDKKRKLKSRYRRRTPTGSGNRFATDLGYRYFTGRRDDEDEEEVI